jgi:hypothetical protein
MVKPEPDAGNNVCHCYTVESFKLIIAIQVPSNERRKNTSYTTTERCSLSYQRFLSVVKISQ